MQTDRTSSSRRLEWISLDLIVEAAPNPWGEISYIVHTGSVSDSASESVSEFFDFDYRQ
jgi:hypothetical protein